MGKSYTTTCCKPEFAVTADSDSTGCRTAAAFGMNVGNRCTGSGKTAASLKADLEGPR